MKLPMIFSIYLLKLKSNANNAFQKFYTLIEIQFGSKIKVVRSDNGGEFDMKDFYLEKGIIYQKYCVETLRENSTIERKHQHILNVARALKFNVRS